MSSFVEECRREWKRLRVPDPIANEMAADLEADLAEAEAEGASAEQVLGSGAFDPRSFAASWAAERGVIHSPPPTTRSRASLRSLVPVALACVAVVVIVASTVALLGGGRSGTTKVAVSPIDPRHAPPPAARAFPMQIDGDGYHHALGFAVLLVAMLAVLILAVLYWAPWPGLGQRSRRHRFVEESPGGLHRE